MRLSLALAAVAAPSALAFPWLKPEGLEALMNHPEAREAIERRLAEYEAGEETKVVRRQANTGLVNGIVTLLGGTLSAVADNVLGLIPTNDAVKGLKKFPEGKSSRVACMLKHSSNMTFHSGIPIQSPWVNRSARTMPWTQHTCKPWM